MLRGLPVLATSDVIAFAPTTDLARARSFYEAALGLPVVDESAYAVVFDAHGTMLRVTAVAEVAHPGYIVLGWRVTDMGRAVTGLESLGVVFARYEGMEQDAHGVWTTPNGDRVAWFTDPDGNVLSLTEFS
jgi:catechol 2,3-dioxygenase-like lactoylglutathione lyase family enzyme